MQKTFSPRRNNTPVMRHIRAVEKRHVPYKKRKEIPVVLQKEEALEIPFVKEHKEEIKVTEKEKTEPVIQETGKEMKKLSCKEKKAIRKQKKQDELDLMARQPYSTLFQMLMDPFGSIQRSVSNHFVEYSLPGSILANLVKWLLLGALPAHYIATKINQHSFSYVAVSFTKMSAIAAEIGLLGFLCELVILWMLAQSSRVSKNSITFAKMYDTHTHGTPVLIMDAVIALWLVSKYASLHFVLLALVLFMAVALNIYMLYCFQNRCFTRLFIVYACLCVAYVFVMIAYSDYLKLALSDILMLIQ